MDNEVQNIKRACIQGYPVDLFDEKTGIQKIENFIASSKTAQVITINPEMIELAKKNTEFDKILKEAEIVIPDGIGVIIALRIIGLKVKRLPGIEFSQKLFELAQKKNYKVAFLGADTQTIEKAVFEVKKKHEKLNVVYVRNGYFNKDEEKLIVEDIKKANPDLLFVGLGAPKQEFFISNYKNYLNRTIMVGVGGSFDVWSQKIKRAPLIFRKFGLEWFYRFITQPSRFNRIFPTLPLFLLKVIFNFRENRKEY
ncbi:MAG: WecB/TagA/CpsF family glycosyltransferase [Candidatus Gastranaerophilaceae bacterium]